MDEQAKEAQARKLSDCWFEMYRACVLQAPELAEELERLITGSEVVPDAATVRSYLTAIVRGALVTRPAAERPSRLFGRLFG
jgi:hypothetical protein